ncbi:MAG: cell division protein ZapA [Gammaproteobacteria bacterium]|jgi:cell division protein ZapA (FtsZ GTPase activity inhibitor)
MSEDDQDIVTLKIAGIEYQLYCPPEEQSTLIEAGEILDKRIKSIKRKTRNLPIEKVAVLAGLDVVNEFLSNEGASSTEANDESSAATDEKSDVNVSEEKVDSSEEENLSLKLVDEISELSKL